MNSPKQFDPSISLEDDVALQAIEALEAQSVNPNPRPLIPEDPVVPETVIEPVKPVPMPPIPVAAPEPATVITPAQPAIQPDVQPPITVAPEPPVPADPASKMAAELANAPARTQTFRFFVNQKRQLRPIPIAILVTILIGIGVVTYTLVR